MTTCPKPARPMSWTFRARMKAVNARDASNVYNGWLNTRHRVPPTDIETVALRRLHRRGETAIQRPARGDIFLVTENFSAQAGKVGRAQGRRFRDTGTFHAEAGEIGQALAEPVIRHHAAI